MIIYLAAITGVDQSLYEAVEIDGGNRWHKMWHITLPGIAPTISIQFILGLPSILGGSFDQIYNLYSVPVYEVADTLDTYLYRVGLSSARCGVVKINHNAPLVLRISYNIVFRKKGVYDL